MWVDARGRWKVLLPSTAADAWCTAGAAACAAAAVSRSAAATAMRRGPARRHTRATLARVSRCVQWRAEAWLPRLREALRDGLGRRPDDDRDLAPVGQADGSRVCRIALAVYEEGDRGLRRAVATDARAVEAHAPLGEELAQPVGRDGRRFGVKDPGRVVCVERRDARLG